MSGKINICGVRILIVADQQVDSMIIQSILLHDGYRNISHAVDPWNAIQLINNHLFDIVILDMSIHTGQGREVVEATYMTRMGKVKPRTIITTTSDEYSVLRAIESGAHAIITKPYNVLEIIAKIRDQIRVKSTSMVTI